MKPILFAAAASLPGLVAALKLPFRQIRRSPPKHVNSFKSLNVFAALGEDNSLESTRDVLYLATVNIDGTDYPLQMDTGSSDLWVDMGDNKPTTVTEHTLNLTYGSGFAFGHVARGPVSFAGYELKDQSYMRFEEGTNPVFHFGAVGIVGLGFTGLSHIDAEVEETWGRSLLFNIFAQDPTAPNYMAFALERSADSATDVEGSFALGEVDDTYAGVSTTEHIPLFPAKGSTRWTVIMDSYAVDGTSYGLTSKVANAPSDRAVVLLDTGTTYTYVGAAIAQSIYGKVEGAVLNTDLGQWIVPCSAGIHLTLWIGGRPFNIHPLDIVVPSLGDAKTCIGAFLPRLLSVGGSDFDYVLGTNTLRSMYSVYDFGDFDSSNTMGNPYVQLLSVIDMKQAAADFQTVRGGVVNVQETNGAASAGVSTETTTNSNNDQIEKLVNMIPLLFGILGANALILIVLVGGMIYFCCVFRRNREAKNKRSAPLPLATVNAATHSYAAVPTGEDPHERPSVHTRAASRQSQLSRSISKQSMSRNSLHQINTLTADAPYASRSRAGSVSPNASSSQVNLAATNQSAVSLVDAQTKDITDSGDEPFVPPAPIVVPAVRRSVYSEHSSPTVVAASERGVQLVDAPARSSMAIPSPSPTQSQFEDARSHRGSMYSNAPAPPADIAALQRQQEAQRAAFMAALDDSPLPPPRRPRFQGGGGEGRLSAYNAAPVSQDMGLVTPAPQNNRHSYAAPPVGPASPQRSSYVPGSGPRRPAFNPSPFNPGAPGGTSS